MRLRHAIQAGASIEEIYQATGIDPWFLKHLTLILEREESLRETGFANIDEVALRDAKRDGFGDIQLANIWGVTSQAVRAKRWQMGIHPVFKLVDTCSAEFCAATPSITRPMKMSAKRDHLTNVRL